jgi:hypothetical protein
MILAALSERMLHIALACDRELMQGLDPVFNERAMQ